MGNILTTYTSVFTQCIRTRQRNFKRETSQQLMDVKHVNDGFLYDDNDSSDDNDEKVIFYKPKKHT